MTAMTKSELLEFADENGIDGVDGKMTKAAIIKTIEEAETE